MGVTTDKAMTLGEKQQLFVRLQAQWALWVLSHPGWFLRDGEGRILPLGPDGKTGRKAKLVIDGKVTGKMIRVKDLVHMDGGTHSMGIGKDWNLFLYPGSRFNEQGTTPLFVEQGGHPAWRECGEHWESLHPLCRWGGRFGDRDDNHTSLEHNGKK